jgi:PadR family transcriptional regulator, regulatory protein AphA
MEREEVRLNRSSFVVLGLLKWLGESTPYDLKRFLEKSVENFWPVPHTTFYAEPARLARGGYLSERQESGGRRRRLYTLTDKGARALEAWVAEADIAPPQLRDDGMLKIFMGADPVPIFAARRRWHEAKVAELEGYLAASDEAGDQEGPRLALQAGIAYHRLLLQAVVDYLERVGEPEASPK